MEYFPTSGRKLETGSWLFCQEADKIETGKVTKTLFATRCEPSLLIARNVGNMYTPSLYGCLSSLLSSGQLKGGEQIGMFSYGSGVCSTFYTIKVNANEQFSKIIRVFKDLPHRLENRTKITPGKRFQNFRNIQK